MDGEMRVGERKDSRESVWIGGLSFVICEVRKGEREGRGEGRRVVGRECTPTDRRPLPYTLPTPDRKTWEEEEIQNALIW